MQENDFIKRLENPQDGPQNPLPLFAEWLKTAEKTEINDPNAMCLATIDPDGHPSVRIVLLKDVDERGFVFYTNRESRKGQALSLHPQAALCFHWKTLGRQVRVEGTVMIVDDAESDAYYASRPKGSRLGAWASRQSRPLENRSTLVHRIEELEKQYQGTDNIPRPPHWGGYRLKPDYIEFWHDGTSRLHTRLVYKRGEKGWERSLLYP
ncbi:MAG: pyridoxamine 5'-phosphate oxidase [Micavibrio aeruginosavorus]|uniref:Pyridoxamine 5'-phosphate oxidase n=1 Tax=Micavibrio aeruginosavorus TaxID=349221 RepID=A0A7T5R469_9BACT|nr:MAG: pyridoxamine 5'-phosphate oxidase [Micavibrio aeruginosavorus]